MLDFRVDTFIELCRTRNYTKTAENLHMTQPAVSQHAKAIELYNTTTGSLKSIARKLNINYNSLGGFLRRNRPDVIINHNNLLKGLE